MDVHVTLTGHGDLAARIYRQLREAVLDGRLRPGERLPPTRELARRLEVSRNTVSIAYDRLTAEGFLVGRVGAGTFVCDEPPGRTLSRSAPTGGGVRPRAFWRSAAPEPGTGTAAFPEPGAGTVAPPEPGTGVAVPREPGAGTAAPPPYDFRVGVPDTGLFPLETWRRLLARELRAALVRPAGYADPAGYPGLREAIARYAGVSRSVRAGATDVLVTAGAQQALDLVGRVLIEPGDLVAVEEPGYPPARALLRSLGARVTGVPVDAEGLVVSALPDAARLVYVTPSHQFPLGTPMSLARRAALLEWAARRGAVVVEDDYDSEFRFEDRPLEPLQSLDRGGHVVYVGSFSKTLLPTLRLGFLVAPASLRPALRAARRLTDWHGEPSAQAALTRFLDEGLMGRHIRRATREYAARRERIVAALRRDFAGLLDPVPSVAGLHLCARVSTGVRLDAGEVVSRARVAGIAVESLAGYCGETPAQAGLVIGYGAITPERIAPGMRRLAEIVRAAVRD
ncbi:MocR-like pyridoxine biosynthesis transcription factor PdxR [Streptosporangium sandarakinum]|uniref:GntR family transcriptional regulator/MocR family aminotransferase n=1 Tax=Streptosporangium sandarakinum TaxID=1260955 RepID=A0A852V3A8_9ACTN|nr:aminotransferase class I/II-fold pyridoxal phosphate-dependent enzyme [Streptosporangium sandarakinum]NYF40731.1 GntR family transcriptional regulator/MocR family aminotransferase [Streptosporangium sandarakinum]